MKENVSFDNIKVVAIELLANNNSEVMIMFNVYHDPKELISDLIYNQLKPYFAQICDDFEFDIERDKNLTTFIDNTLNLLSQAYKLLIDCKYDLLNLEKNPTYDGYKVFIEKFNEHLQLMNKRTKYLFFDNVFEAYNYLLDNYDENAPKDLKAFDEIYVKGNYRYIGKVLMH